MTQEHPITPPPELVKQWLGTYFGATVTGEVSNVELALVNQAARWGADMELEACCADLRMVLGPNQADWLRSVRRPKPPSLKEQALEALDQADKGLSESEWQQRSDTIRRAIESLPD